MENVETEATPKEDGSCEYLECEEDRVQTKTGKFSPVSEQFFEDGQGNDESQKYPPFKTDETPSMMNLQMAETDVEEFLPVSKRKFDAKFSKYVEDDSLSVNVFRILRGMENKAYFKRECSDSLLDVTIKGQIKKTPSRNPSDVAKFANVSVFAVVALSFVAGFAIGWWPTISPVLRQRFDQFFETEIEPGTFVATTSQSKLREAFSLYAKNVDLRQAYLEILELMDNKTTVKNMSNDSEQEKRIFGRQEMEVLELDILFTLTTVCVVLCFVLAYIAVLAVAYESLAASDLMSDRKRIENITSEVIKIMSCK